MFKGRLAATLFSFLALFFLHCESDNQTLPITQVNQIEDKDESFKDEFTRKIIRYIGRKPEDASHENKFHPYFDAFYENQVNQHELIAYHKKEAKEYFVFTRIAPSIHLKKVAIGGYVQFESNGELKDIELAFRTWKQEPDTLLKRVELLFSKLIMGEPLTPYYTENSGNTEYIEFPNSEVWYDKKERRWLSSREDVLSEFIQAKIDRTKVKIKEFEETELKDSL
jgi:hypothetical protein